MWLQVTNYNSLLKVIASRNRSNVISWDIQNTSNEEYKSFDHAYMEATAVECLPIKLRAKHRVPWETLAVKKKRDNVKTTCLCNNRNPTNANDQKLEAERELIHAYEKELIEFF